MHDLPAILGGPPVRPQGPPDWPPVDPDIAAAIDQALRDGSWGKYDGGHVEQLEADLASYHNVPFALTCASGTLAVELGLRALKLQAGDEVIVPAYDYEANFLCVHAVGATPVLVDVELQGAGLDLEQLAHAVGPQTRAVVVSHLHGGLVPMRDMMQLAARHDLRVVEDAAQAPGATVQGQRAGTWGDIGILSFGGSKLLSAGRGGALLTRQAELRQRLRVELRRGVQQWGALSELQALVLRPQLAKLDARNATRAASVQDLRAALADVPGLRPFSTTLVDSQAGYYKLGFWFDEEKFGISRMRFNSALRAEGIAMDEGFRAVHLGRSGSRFRSADRLNNAERAHHDVVILHHPVLLEGHGAVAEVARAVRKTYANVDRLRT